MSKFASTDAFLEVEMTPTMADYARVVAGISHSLGFDNGDTDTSDKDESRWGSQESFGKRVLTIPVEGFVTDDASYNVVYDAVVAGTANINFRYNYGDGQTVTGKFSISGFNLDAPNFDAQKVTWSLVNNGVPAFA